MSLVTLLLLLLAVVVSASCSRYGGGFSSSCAFVSNTYNDGNQPQIATRTTTTRTTTTRTATTKTRAKITSPSAVSTFTRSKHPIMIGNSIVTKTDRRFYHHDERLFLEEDDNNNKATILPLSLDDQKRFSELKSRYKTIPIMILDAMLPKQKLTFESSDPRFHKLVEYVIDGPQEIGMIGFNPHTGRPLNMGVTVRVNSENVVNHNSNTNKGHRLSNNNNNNNNMYNKNNHNNNHNHNNRDNSLTLCVQGYKRFEVQGEPWLHEESDESFYLADIEIIENREEKLTKEMERTVKELYHCIPDLVRDWIQQRVTTLQSSSDDARVIKEQLLKDIGPMPHRIRDRALWVAALVNPMVQTQLQRVCLEIRPAMLSCRNDHDRMVLASAALQSSIDHMSGKRRLF